MYLREEGGRAGRREGGRGGKREGGFQFKYSCMSSLESKSKSKSRETYNCI